MLRKRKTKIISAPAEEILEVETPVVEEEVEEVEILDPVVYEVSNIEFIVIQKTMDGEEYGKLTDYNGNEYFYGWDLKARRVIRLASIVKIDSLTWDLCNEVLKKYYIKPVLEKVEEPVGLQVEKAINKALAPVSEAFKRMDSKIEKALTAKPVAPTPVLAQPAPRPQMIQSAPSINNDTPAINVADDDISINAMRFLQESNTPDLGIDYMSL